MIKSETNPTSANLINSSSSKKTLAETDQWLEKKLPYYIKNYLEKK